MNDEEKISTLTLAILCLLAYEPDSAYGLRRAFSTTPMGHFSASPGAVYPALKRMEGRGWISGRTANADTLRPKRVYEITEAGLGVLRERMRLKVTRDDVIWHMDDLLLRFAFMGKLLEREEVLVFLRQLESETKEYLLYLRNLHDSAGAQLGLCERLALEHGIGGYRMNLNWTRRAIAEVLGAESMSLHGGRQA
jgi:DNA-binding PadR family transcriptional regulator